MTKNNKLVTQNMPEIFPESWASDWGQDKYGLWMAFSFKGVRQCFRWIMPGEFIMGSPEDEPERLNDEKQHRVILTKGYWLADTACTQGLWIAVMGNNPSEVKGNNRPVEKVSWNDAIEFIEKLNSLKHGLDLRLPTEAEWEYACRAGTTTPFSFGSNITPDEVNYNGNHPYEGGKKGLFRKKTVEVKSLPCNEWGLYEMHGNVWEWCRDWYGDYSETDAVDPEGLDKGVYRVLRGGSWINDARIARSALRGRDAPDNRDGSVGFRLARGQIERSKVSGS